jgi:hypothetical protein
MISLMMAIEIVRQSVIASLAKLIQTVTMMETDAVLTPSRIAENNRDFRIRGTRDLLRSLPFSLVRLIRTEIRRPWEKSRGLLYLILVFEFASGTTDW